MQLSRENVEKLLDLQVSAGRMSPELKEEKMREFDMQVQAQQNGQQMQTQFNGQQMQMQTQLNGQRMRTDSYPRVGQSQGILSGPEMLVIFALAIVLVICAMRGNGWATVFLCGILFTYISGRVIVYSLQNGKGFNYSMLIFIVCGVGMLIYGLFLKVGSDEVKNAFAALNDVLAIGSVIIVGIGLIISQFVKNSMNKKKYYQRVEAKCIELRIPQHGTNIPVKLSPVYEYYYNGQYKRVMNNIFSNKGYPQVGETRDIYINPDIEDSYYEPIMSTKISIFMCILGVFFIFMGILAFVLTR